MTTKTKMNKEFLKNKVTFIVVSDFLEESLGFEKGDILCLFDKELDYTEEYIEHKENFTTKERKKKKYFYKYHLVDINSGFWHLLDEEGYTEFRERANCYIDITKDKGETK